MLLVAVAICLSVGGCAPKYSVRRQISSARILSYHQRKDHQKRFDLERPHVDGRLSLEDALKLSLTHNKALHAVIQERDAAQGRVLSSYSGLLPTISLLGSYTRYDKDAYDKSAIGSLDEYSTDVKITQPISRGGATKAEIRSARLMACYGDAQIRQQTETTLYNVTSSYYQVLLARQLLKVTQDAVTSAETYLNEVTRKRNSGAATEYNVLRARVDVALYKAQMIKQRNKLNLATTQLLKEMGARQDSRIELSGSLVYRSMQPIFEEAIELAYLNRPDLFQAQAYVLMSEEAIRLAASQYWPKVIAFANGGVARPDPYQSTRDDWDSHASVGISVELPLFDGLQREGRMVESKALLRRRQFELLDIEEQAVLEIRQAVLSLRDAEKFIDSQQMNLQLAREGLRLAEIGYRNGVNTAIDVTDARSSLTRAMGLHYQAVYDHATARLMLQKACGTLAPTRLVDKKSAGSGHASQSPHVKGKHICEAN